MSCLSKKFQHLSKNALISHLCLCILLLMPLFSRAEEVAGKTILAKGKVEATNQANNETRKLKRRSKIFNVDNILTGSKSKVQFSMLDGGLITLKENTEIRISEYKFNQATGDSAATLEVVNGGLRSISGLIKKSGGDYHVKTPVGSIGIRGTHFSVDVIDGRTFFAVYSGNIDVLLNNNETLSLGVSEDFSFASVSTSGEIERLTQAPVEIATGYIDNESISAKQQSSTTSEANVATVEDNYVDESLSPLALAGNTAQPTPLTDESTIYNESQWQGMTGTPIAELVAAKTGTLTYQYSGDSNVFSSQGQVSNFTMDMTIDFDNASVPGGTLSFSDDKGEWFAAYSGLVNVDQLDLGVNFASHGNKRAEGTIFAGFSDGLDEVAGGFELNEVEDKSVTSDGTYKLTSK